MISWYRLSFRKVAYSILSLYLVVTCYTGFHLLTRRLQIRAQDKELLERIKSLSLSEMADDPEWNPWGEEFESEQGPRLHHAPPPLWSVERPVAKRSPLDSKDANTSSQELVVEIWGKAAIGLYLWEHILGGLLESRMNGVWSYGERTLRPITFRFRTGPGVVPSKVPRFAENVVLVLNGRSPAQVEASRPWLDLLPSLPMLRNAAVLMLGNERCDNSWLLQYMSHQGGRVKVAFLVYDSPLVDNEHFFQWPLGVATYRQFPLIDSSDLPLYQKRHYMYNFMGTVHPNSTRQDLMKALNTSSFRNKGYVKPRMEWMPQETEDTRNAFTEALAQSDLTLNPVGFNTECYRIYEALSFGSVPVIEDVMTPGYCGNGPGMNNSLRHSISRPDGSLDKRNLTAYKHYSPPLRLLKEFGAPVIYIKNWLTDLEPLLKKEAEMSDYDRSKRRANAVKWYNKFKVAMRDRFHEVLLKKFFNIQRR
ncbi:ribitol-5-phosphate xylosyltransferase 1 [Aplysia californica]|uniref:Ribitol-5-phosphate xylosyltransferase 1 n=1 Tax=Aplysia californica TaxID=6500 RepID=A0ABM0JCB9_APLCA|nr:ribitol-5-phosphate xylosyltransferase 1 [Aplysia californica]